MDPMSLDLFDGELGARSVEELRPSALLLRGYALAREAAILGAVRAVESAAAFRHMTTPGGLRMSVAMTNCGALGWVSDRSGYRYDSIDPLSGKPWPAMPDCLRDLAQDAAASAGFPQFRPDACLVNRYAVASRLSLHQDKDERDFSAPIVSVSLGLPAVFQLGGLKRSDRTLRVAVRHGDVIVWGASARLLYHGVLPLKHGYHAAFGDYRINLTFRKAA
jgi:alkylated DNA repair protein (DNA oxidative demethylase)